MKRFLTTLFVFTLFFSAAQAVLKEKDLARTLGVLRAELTSDYNRQQMFMQMYEQQGARQHEELVSYMNRCEQIGLMLYSQSTENTFDLAYACQQAVDLFRELHNPKQYGNKFHAYDRAIARIKSEIASPPWQMKNCCRRATAFCFLPSTLWRPSATHWRS